MTVIHRLLTQIDGNEVARQIQDELPDDEYEHAEDTVMETNDITLQILLMGLSLKN